jgi:hypothetical protein
VNRVNPWTQEEVTSTKAPLGDVERMISRMKAAF